MLAQTTIIKEEKLQKGRKPSLIKETNPKMYVELPDLAEKGRTPVVESEAEEEDATGVILPEPVNKRKTKSFNKIPLDCTFRSKEVPAYQDVPLKTVRFQKDDFLTSPQISNSTKSNNNHAQSPTSKGYYIYLMANPRSGSQKAGRFIRDYGEQTNVLSIGDDTTCTVRVYNVITQKKEYSESIENVLMNRTQGQEIIIVVMGGDGSIGRFVEGLQENKVIEENLETIIFTPLPFGTGNDLSRSLGWGKSEGKWAANLTTLVTALVKGEEDRLAIWQVDANAEVYGFDSKKMVIRSTTDKKFTKLMLRCRRCQWQASFYKRKLSAFEQRRSGNRWINNFWYAYLVAKDGVCTCNIINVKDMFQSMSEMPKLDSSEESKGESKVVFDRTQINGNPFAIIGTNITSNYGGMTSEAWFKNKKNNILPKDVSVNRLGTQSYADDKLEILSCVSRSQLFFLKKMHSLCQMQGAFDLNFRKDLPPKIPISFALDGESYVLMDADKISFRQLETAPFLRVKRGPLPRLRA